MRANKAMSRSIPHTGRGKWVGILLGAVVVVGVLIWMVVSGFRGQQIRKDAAAMTAPGVTGLPAAPPAQ